MATRLYRINRGANYTTVTQEAGSATTGGMELTIDLAKFTSKHEALICLQELITYITRANWKPA